MQDPPDPGVLLYDEYNQRGYACIAGADPLPVNNPHELSSKAVWMTNIVNDDFYQRGYTGSNRFRNSTYLRADLDRIGDELGITEMRHGAYTAQGEMAVQVLADFFGNVMNAAWLLGVSGFPAYSLRHGFRQLYCRPQRPESPPIESAAANACQFATRCQLPPTGRGAMVDVHFRRHRYQHALEILTKPIPVGPWRTMAKMSSHEIVNHRLPLLLQVNVHSVDSRMGPVVNFGSDQRRHTAAYAQRVADAHPRQWMTLPEYEFLLPHADIEVLGIYEGSGYVNNPMHDALAHIGPLQQTSLAFLVCCEAIWSALLRDEKDFALRGPAQAWITAYDRIALMRDAMTLMERDTELQVAWYSYGWMKVKVPERKPQDGAWYHDLIRQTALVPGRLCKKDRFDMNIPQGDTTAICQGLALWGDTDLIIRNDVRAIQNLHRRLATAEDGVRTNFNYSS